MASDSIVAGKVRPKAPRRPPVSGHFYLERTMAKAKKGGKGKGGKKGC